MSTTLADPPRAAARLDGQLRLFADLRLDVAARSCRWCGTPGDECDALHPCCPECDHSRTLQIDGWHAAQMQRLAEHTGEILVWIVYDRPIEFPASVVARVYSTGGGLLPSPFFLAAPSLPALRAQLPEGLVCLEHVRQDSSRIVESWI
jgi:hypothetical protein